MLKHSCQVCIIALVLLTTRSLFSIGQAEPKPKQELLIGAASSLKEVFEELSPVFEKENPSVTLVFQFAASGALQQQIEQGAPFDVFVSAAHKQVDILLKKDLLVTDSVQTLFGNSLVLVVPRNKKSFHKIEDLKQPEYKRIAIGEKQTVPAGQYAEQWLEKNKLLPIIKDRLVPASNVRQVLTFVESGNVDAGFVYKTDALASSAVNVAIEAAADQHDPIAYPLALVKKSKKLDSAKIFASFLKSDPARVILLKRGFVLPSEKTL